MRSSLPLLLFAVALPGALSQGIYRQLLRDPPPAERAHVIELAPPIEVRVTEVVPATLSWEDRVCQVQEQRLPSISATALDRLKVRAGTGALQVRGVEGAQQVSVRALLCASDRGRLLAMDLELRRVMGPDLLLQTVQPDPEGGLDWSDDEYARIDLALEVPLGMAVAVEDGSGPLVVSGVGELSLRDGAGEIDVQDVRGNLSIDDGSGSLRVRSVRGDAEILDGSGAVEVRSVTGSLRVAGTTGEVVVSEVAGEVALPAGAAVTVPASPAPATEAPNAPGGA